MKKVLYVLMGLYCLGVLVSNAEANNVTDTLTSGQTPVDGDILYYNGVAGNTAGTWAQPSSIPGLTGATGATGAAGTNGVNGAAGTDGTNGTNGKDGKNGLNGINGKDATVPAIDPRMDVEVREFDSKHWSMASYASFGFQTGTSRYIVGQKLTLKLGKSYEQKMIEKMQAELKGRNVIELPE